MGGGIRGGKDRHRSRILPIKLIHSEENENAKSQKDSTTSAPRQTNTFKEGDELCTAAMIQER